MEHSCRQRFLAMATLHALHVVAPPPASDALLPNRPELDPRAVALPSGAALRSRLN